MMFIIGNLLLAVGRVLSLLVDIFYLLIIVRAALSWLDIDPGGQIVKILKVATEPLLSRIRRYMPPSGIDFSPIIALVILYFTNNFIVESLLEMGSRLQ